MSTLLYWDARISRRCAQPLSGSWVPRYRSSIAAAPLDDEHIRYSIQKGYCIPTRAMKGHCRSGVAAMHNTLARSLAKYWDCPSLPAMLTYKEIHIIMSEDIAAFYEDEESPIIPSEAKSFSIQRSEERRV